MAPWQDVAASVQRHRDASIARVPGSPLPAVAAADARPLNVTAVPRQVLTARECELTELPVEALLARYAAGTLTVEEAVGAFLRRAALAQQLVNCITELLPERALDRARALDEHFRRTGRLAGPLHGVPLSVKEHVHLRGLGANAGFVSWADRVADEDATLVRYLWQAGCVLYARTTEPQTLMQIETASNLYGVTVNPFNTRLTSGGSSGGEGALLGLRGSCLGIATDIGGSIRSPAANNGLYGFKPTARRLPGGGMPAAMAGSEHILATGGPVSTSLAGIKLFVQSVLDQQPHLVEPALVPLPWRHQASFLPPATAGKPRLTVGVMWTDGVVRPHPPVRRALQTLVDRLSASPDIAVVEWTPFRHDHAWEILSALYFADGGEDVLEAIAASGEPLLPLSRWILDETCGDGPALTVRETWAWQLKRNAYATAYADHWNRSAGVDVVLCPVGPGAAPPLGCARYWGYTAVWNVLDYPALVFPVTSVDPAVDTAEPDYQPQNERDAYNHGLYDPEVYRDAPVCLQLVGRRFDDEKVIESFELMQSVFA